MAAVNEENAFTYEKTLLSTIVKNTKEANKVIKFLYLVRIEMFLLICI